MAKTYIAVCPGRGNYNLKYKSPYEDKSGTLPEIDFSKDDVDSIIASLGNHPYLPDAKPSYKYNV